MNDAPDDFRKRKRRPKPGDLAALRRILWSAQLEVEKILTDENSTETKLKAASATATLAGTYLKVLEQADLETRLAALEAPRR